MSADFDLGDLSPADDRSGLLRDIAAQSDLDLLARHDVGNRSYLLAFDNGTLQGKALNMPDLFTLDVRRDQAQGTFALDAAAHAGVAFAQKWLAERGCPPEAMTVDGDLIGADELTYRIEDQIHRAGERYDLIALAAARESPGEAWTMVTDRNATELPVRLFIEHSDAEQNTYTIREGAFPDRTGAEAWLAERNTPLPEPPEYRTDADALRTRAALARSAAPAAPGVAEITAAAPAAAALAQPDRGRSL
ncbi:glycosyl hydrolase [Kitasatospora brasiliensis]|uniref:glycosyl hydrolase n=1 Tax=Kitasatospora brasiliensis TaxID=3058040 RepID=UPI00292D1E51|nr:glycosyl hydrolase [Kitasatospora sp. K002]